MGESFESWVEILQIEINIQSLERGIHTDDEVLFPFVFLSEYSLECQVSCLHVSFMKRTSSTNKTSNIHSNLVFLLKATKNHQKWHSKWKRERSQVAVKSNCLYHFPIESRATTPIKLPCDVNCKAAFFASGFSKHKHKNLFCYFTLKSLKASEMNTVNLAMLFYLSSEDIKISRWCFSSKEAERNFELDSKALKKNWIKFFGFVL